MKGTGIFPMILNPQLLTGDFWGAHLCDDKKFPAFHLNCLVVAVGFDPHPPLLKTPRSFVGANPEGPTKIGNPIGIQ